MATIHLQGIGSVAAKQAFDFVVGNYAVFNYARAYRVVSIKSVSPHFIEMGLSSGSQIYTKKVKKTKLVGWSSSFEDWMN